MFERALREKERKNGHRIVARLEDEITVTKVFYQIQVTTKPSMALYESTVEHSISENTYTVNDNEITRVNVYRDQPHCVAA